MARNTQTRAGDYTGVLKADLAEQAAKEKEAAAAQLAEATAALAPTEQETVDLAPTETVVAAPVVQEIGDDIAVTAVDVVDPSLEKVTFRVNENLEQVTIGHGRNYDFIQGQEYRAERYIRDHLEEKGLIWH